MLINDSPIGNGPSTEMRVGGEGYVGCWGGVGRGEGEIEGAAGEFCGSIER